MKLSIEKLQNLLMYILLFFAAMNLMAKFFYFVFGAFFVLLFRRKLLLDRGILPYLLLSGLMAVYNYSEGMLSMLRCLAWIIFYLVGLNLTAAGNATGPRLEYDREQSRKRCHRILVVLAAGSFSHYLLNFFYNFQNIMGRNTNDIWTGATMAATGQAALSCIMCGLAVAWIFAPERKGARFLGICCVGGMLIYDLVLACRTPIAIVAVLLVLGIVYLLKTAENQSKRLRLVLMLLAVFFTGLAVLYSGLVDLEQILGDTNLGERFDWSLSSLGETARFVSKKWFLDNALDYPFGGQHLMVRYGYAHDLWLDGYDEYGVLGLALLLAITVTGIYNLLRLLRRTDYSRTFKFTVTCVYAAILLEFCVEPILQGMAWLFACYCLINGCIAGLNYTHQVTDGAAYENTADQHRIP